MESVTLNDNQHLYLQTIFDYFQEEGRWPIHKFLERSFIRTDPDLDIEEIVNSLPAGLTDPVNLNDLNRKAYLSVPAVYMCVNSTQILDNFIRLIQHCAEIFFNPDINEPRITSEELSSLYNAPDWEEKHLRQVGLLLQSEPNIWSAFSFDENDSKWTAVISKGIRRFREVQTIEQYLEIRDNKNQASSTLPYSNDPQVENSSVDASNATAQIAKAQYIPRALGGTLVLPPNQEELPVDNPSADASNIAAQVVNHSEQTQQIEIAISALADTPSKVDLLGFSDYATALADFIKSEKTQKPLTIVVDAPWGMGKTTLMDMIRVQLENPGEKTQKQAFPTVWFNAWKYDKEESLWAALALEILNQVRKKFSLWQRFKFWLRLNTKRFDWGSSLQSLVKPIVSFLSLLVIGVIVYLITLLLPNGTLPDLLRKLSFPVIGGLGLITALYMAGKAVYDQIIKPFDLNVAKYVHEPNYKERIGFLAEFEDDFGIVIEAVTENGKWPLVVFIDDLDRCAPPKSVEIIEAINILLDSKYCVFIMGMDLQSVAGSIEAKYKDLQSSYADKTSEMTLGQRFLEKIVQINFHIPKANLVTVRSFIQAHLEVSSKQPQVKSPKKEIVEAEQLIKAEQRTGKSLELAAQVVQGENPHIPITIVEQAKQEIFVKTFDDSEEVLRAINEAAPYLGFNPRKLKRFINAFRLQAFIANRRGLIGKEVIKLDLLAKWMIIVTRWPSFVEAMMANQKFVNNLKSAYKTLDDLNQSRITPSQATRRNSAISSASSPSITSMRQEKEEQETILQNKLNFYTEDPYIKRLKDAADLKVLLDQMSNSDVEDLSNYLYLTQAIT